MTFNNEINLIQRKIRIVWQIKRITIKKIVDKIQKEKCKFIFEILKFFLEVAAFWIGATWKKEDGL